jgi:hypothetical protein
VYDVHGCTANFVFQTTAGAFDPAQQLYLGTAGHCVNLGQIVQAVAIAPGSTNPVLVTVGPAVVDDDTNDFALVEIDPALNSWVSPSMAHWGGPTGVYAGPSGGVVTWVGHGGFVGGAVPRAGTLTAFRTADIEVATPDVSGDSGSPVTTIDGLAVGELRAVYPPNGLLNGVPAGIRAIGPSIGRMLSVGGKPLATCPTRTPWPLPGCPAV